MMDCSSQFSLGIGNEVKGVVKTEQDSQQYAQLHPVQQQADRLKTHFPLLALGARKAPSGRPAWDGAEIGHGLARTERWPRNLAAVDFNRMPVNQVSRPASCARLHLVSVG